MGRTANIWRESELAIWDPPTELPVSLWAEKNRILAATSEERGPFRLRRVPYMAAIMDAANDPEVETIVFCKSAQIAYSTGLENIVGYFATEESAAILFVLADVDTAEYLMTKRIEPMFRDSPAMRRHWESGRFNKTEIILANGSYIAMAWASSVSALGTRNFQYILLDEIDKPGYYASSKEASALSLAIERKESYFRFKIFMGSTPTIETGNITRELDSCDTVYDWHVPCPHCGTSQPLRWGGKYCHGFADNVYRAEDGTFHQLGRVSWEGHRNATAEQIAAAGYECGTCQRLWTSIEKDHAVELGRMVARAGSNGRRKKIGFHVNRLYSLLGKSGDIPKLVDAWLQAFASGDPKKMQGFVNSTLAEPWVQAVIKRSEAEVLNARANVAPQVLPAGAVALTAFVDPQKYGFWFLVRAWARDYRSWMIHYGRLSTWDEVRDLLFATAYPVEGTERKARIWRAAIDTGGTKFDNDPSMTEQAYWFCRKFSSGRGCQVWGTKGASNPLSGKIHVGKPLDKMPSGKPIPGGLQLVLLDTDKLKDQFHYRLRSAIEGEGDQAAYLHREAKADYARHILAEEKRVNEKGLQEWVRLRPDNHWFDCFDPETEILTEGGWKNVALVDCDDKCATVNLEKDLIEYQNPTRTIAREHHGKMVSINGRRCDILVTPNHRMVIHRKKFDGKKRKHIFNTPAEIKLARDLIIWDRIKVTSNWEGEDRKTFIIPKIDKPHKNDRHKHADIEVDAEDMASFLGWFVSEGHTNASAKGSYRIFITQNPGEKSEKIKELLNRLPWKWNLFSGRQFCIHSRQLYLYLHSIGLGVKCYEKSVPRIIKNSSPRIISAFLRSAIAGDGWTQRRSGFRTYATTSKRLSDDIQELFIKTGKSARIKERDVPPCRMRGECHATRRQYHVSERCTKAISLRDSKNNSIISEVGYSGMVHCVSVPNTTLVCRRGGSSFIAGNCEIGCAALADPEWPGGGVHILARLIEIENAKRTATTGRAERDATERSGGGFERPAWLDR